MASTTDVPPVRIGISVAASYGIIKPNQLASHAVPPAHCSRLPAL